MSVPIEICRAFSVNILCSWTVPRHKAKTMNLSSRGWNLCDRRSQTTSWTLSATFVVLLEGWGKSTPSLWMLPYSMLVTWGRGNRGLDNPATLWLDWHLLSSNKLLLSGAMGALGHDLGVLTVTACYFLSRSCQEATDVSIKIFDRSTSWAKCESIDVYNITTKRLSIGLGDNST